MSALARASDPLQHRAIDAVACGLAIAIAGGISWIGLRPIFDSEGVRRGMVLQAQHAGKQLAEAQEEYVQLRKSLESAEHHLAENRVQLVAADRLTVRQEQLAASMTEGGLQLDQLVVGTRTPGQLVDCVPFHLSGQGTFPEVVGQMHNLRTRFPDMAITSFQMSAAGKGSENTGVTRVRFTFEVAWFTVRNGSAG